MRILLAMAVVAAAALPESACAQETIALRFAWPERVAARVEAQQIRARLAGDRMDSVVVAVMYTMRAEPHPEGRVVRYSDFLFSGRPGGSSFSGRPGESSAIPPTMVDRAAAMVPSLIISNLGEFMRLEDVPALRAQLDSLLAPILRELPADGRGEEAMSTIRSMLSDESLEASAADEWNTVVAQWIDADLQLAGEYTYESIAPYPLLPGVSLSYVHEFAITRRVPCTETSSTENCVEIVMFSAPDASAVAEVMDRFLRQLTKVEQDPGQPLFRDIEVENSITLVLEPATLLPHSATIVRQFSGTITIPDEPEQEFFHVDLKSWKYSYGR